MFYGEEYNIPPCCDQKYFRFLWDELKSIPTTQLFMQADYSLQQVLAQALLHVPMCTLTLMVPEITPNLVTSLRYHLSRHWFDGKTNDHLALEHLTLIAPQEAYDQCPEVFSLLPPNDPKASKALPPNDPKDLKVSTPPTSPRVTLAISPTLHTLFTIKNQTHNYAFSGTTHQHPTTAHQLLTVLSVSRDPTIIKETETVLRLLSHKTITP